MWYAAITVNEFLTYKRMKKMKTLPIKSLLLLITALFLSACSSTGTLGIVTKSSAEPLKLLKSSQNFEEIGPAKGEACRYFLLAVIPWGVSDMGKAIDDALAKSGGDALVNVSVTSSLYGFIPLYNVLSYTCTTVQGIAIKFS